MKTVIFKFKDGFETKVTIEDYVLDMWLNDKQMKSAIRKVGTLILDEKYLEEVDWTGTVHSCDDTVDRDILENGLKEMLERNSK